MKRFLLSVFIVIAVLLIVPQSADAAVPLESRVNESFRAAFGRNPTRAENDYWRGRVVRKDKKTFEALLGAMLYHKALGKSIGDSTSSKVAAATTASSGSTNKQQLIVDVLTLFEKYVGAKPTAAEKAWWRKRISCGEIENETALVNSMKYHKAKGARIGSSSICGGTAAASTPKGSTGGDISGVDKHQFGNIVRIGIYGTSASGTITVTANSRFQVRDGNDTKATVGKDDVVKVTYSDGKYHVRGAATVDGSGPIRLVPLDNGIMQVTSYNDKSSTIAGKNYNRFRGIIEVKKCDGCDELWAVNELRTELYLRGLAETSGTGPEEYIKALGIAARTYVLYHHVVTGGRNTAKGYDIGRTAADQVYRGYEYEVITSRMSSIFNETRGIVATDTSNDLVTTVYFSDSDGRTRSAKEVWNTSRFPHLQSVEDPYHASSSCNGHCTGMSAQGAFGFAKAEGWSYEKILKYYFKGIKLVKAY